MHRKIPCPAAGSAVSTSAFKKGAPPALGHLAGFEGQSGASAMMVSRGASMRGALRGCQRAAPVPQEVAERAS